MSSTLLRRHSWCQRGAFRHVSGCLAGWFDFRLRGDRACRRLCLRVFLPLPRIARRFPMLLQFLRLIDARELRAVEVRKPVPSLQRRSEDGDKPDGLLTPVVSKASRLTSSARSTGDKPDGLLTSVVSKASRLTSSARSTFHLDELFRKFSVVRSSRQSSVSVGTKLRWRYPFRVETCRDRRYHPTLPPLTDTGN
jgi:hypothetical protein